MVSPGRTLAGPRPSWQHGAAIAVPSRDAQRWIGANILIAKPKHIGHGIQARLLVPAPKRGLDGTARENAAIFRDMGEFDALARPRENHFVIADHRPATQARKADIANLAQARVAVPHADRMLFELNATAVRRRRAEEKRGAGGRIHLHAMMHFNDLDVVFRPERAGGLFDERGEEIDAKTHIAGSHDDCVAPGGL